MSRRLVTMLERLQADAVESKFATMRECAIYQSAVADMLNMVRGEGWMLLGEATPDTEADGVVFCGKCGASK